MSHFLGQEGLKSFGLLNVDFWWLKLAPRLGASVHSKSRLNCHNLFFDRAISNSAY